MQTVLIAGGTGLIGSALEGLLREWNLRVIILSRSSHPQPSDPLLSYAQWNVAERQIDAEAVTSADYVVQLAGAGIIDRNWTKAYREEIRRSRIESTRFLRDSLRDIPNRVQAVACASATGYYGDSQDHVFNEGDGPAPDFMGETCRLWEEAAREISALGKRVVILRTGMVLSSDGGALEKFVTPLRFGIAGILGRGDQWVSWIHIRDLCRLYFNAIRNERLTGLYNAVAPSAVTNKELVMTLARTLKGPNFLPVHVPEFLLRLLKGEMGGEALKSCRVSSGRMAEDSFQFSYPTLHSAFEGLFGKKGQKP
jgi:uncharacterized protein (TIGR01777 family)